MATHLCALVLVALLGVAGAAQPRGDDRADLTVHLYDYVAISEETLSDAVTEAGRILRIAGITTEWRVHAFHDPNAMASAVRFTFGPTHIAVRVMPAEMATLMGLAPDALGFAFPSQIDGIGTLALVLFDQIAGTTRHPGFLMGNVIAHEIGHLLLGPNSHAPNGIMQDPWTPAVLEEAYRGQLLFSPEQVSLMRERVNARDND